MPTGHPSNGQNAMAKEISAANSRINNAANQRAADKKKAEAKEKITNLNTSIKEITKRMGQAQVAMNAAQTTVNYYKHLNDVYHANNWAAAGYPNRYADTLFYTGTGYYLGPATTELALQTKKFNDTNTQLKNFKKQLSDLNNPVTKPNVPVATKGAPTSIKNGQYLNGDGKKKAFSKDYMYNAPMVKAAYFGSQSFQDNILGNNRVDPGAYTDARKAWSGVTGGRGTIQMDKKVIQTMEPQLSGQSEKLDLQKYGFKFLYNPTTVSMAWGLMNYMDPPWEAAGKDAFAPVSAGLMTSTVDFELILNRIEDFNHLNENGLDGFNPYAVIVPSDDLKDIYRQGTMYDMEYLLKTLNAPSAKYTSELNGSTSDRSWLRPTIVELHLGNAMRYRVRIANLSINHIMFNSRMVPILSSVKITCSRFNDGPTAMPSNAIVGSHKPYADKRIQK